MDAQHAQAAKAPLHAFVTPLTENHLENPDYEPVKLLNTILERLKLKNDAAMARVLQLPPPVISKIRKKQVPMTQAILVRVHDITGWSISDIRALCNIKSNVRDLSAASAE